MSEIIGAIAALIGPLLNIFKKPPPPDVVPESVQRLHRAQELVRQTIATELYLLKCWHNKEDFAKSRLAKLSARQSANQGELRGLALAIDDKEFLKLINKTLDYRRLPDEKRHYMLEEMDLRLHAQQLHTRLSQLLEEATK